MGSAISIALFDISVDFADEDPIDFEKTYRVVRPEEKQTDVNVAIHMVADAYEDNCDQQVLVSNDSDYVPSVQMVREKFPSMTLGLIAPLPVANKEDRQINAKSLNHSLTFSFMIVPALEATLLR